MENKLIDGIQRLRGKTAVITGGGSGIGKESCLLLAAHGANLVVTDIDHQAAKSVASLINKQGGCALAVKHDVASEASWQEVMCLTKENFSALNILVNNAGVCTQKEILGTTIDDWRRIMSVNLDGVFLGIREAIKAMHEADNHNSIINISSVNGLSSGGIEYSAAYCASKAGVRLLTRSAALECGRKGYKIRINTICPGGVNTPMNNMLDREELEAKKRCHPIGRMAEPLDIARAVLFLASDESAFMTGTDLVVDGGVTAGFVSGCYPQDSDSLSMGV